LEERLESEYSKNISLERRNQELKAMVESFHTSKLFEHGEKNITKAQNIIESGLFNPSKEEMSFEDINFGIKVGIQSFPTSYFSYFNVD
jgi:hypothetical protein